MISSGPTEFVPRSAAVSVASATLPVRTLFGASASVVTALIPSSSAPTELAGVAVSRVIAPGARSRARTPPSASCFEPTVPFFSFAPLISFAACAGPPRAMKRASDATIIGAEGRRMRGGIDGMSARTIGLRAAHRAGVDGRTRHARS